MTRPLPRTAPPPQGPEAARLPEGCRWFVVVSQPRKEGWARLNLERQGFACFAPTIRKTVRHARRHREKLVPLFPRYLFVALDLGRHQWRSVRGTFGVTTLVMEGERPRPVPPGIVETLAAASDGAGGYDFEAELQPGQKVRFLAGPFADRIGTLTALDEGGRVRVLLELLGAEREIAAASGNLIPAGG
jgi:transcription elongation factor/antiterminator RfaH